MELKDYAHLYIGCRCFNTWFPEGHSGYDRNWVFSGYCPTYGTKGNPYYLENEDDVTWTDSIKPILRKLEDMTEEEMIGFIQSMVPMDMEDKPSPDDYSLEMFYNDDGLMVDGDIAVGANYSCRCYEGQIGIKKCGSIILFEEDKDVTRDQLINTPLAFRYLLTQHFDLFGLIDAGIAIDSKTLNEHTNENNQDNEPPMCHWCNGTGENTSGTGSCRDCKGTGVQVKKK